MVNKMKMVVSFATLASGFVFFCSSAVTAAVPADAEIERVAKEFIDKIQLDCGDRRFFLYGDDDRRSFIWPRQLTKQHQIVELNPKYTKIDTVLVDAGAAHSGVAVEWRLNLGIKAKRWRFNNDKSGWHGAIEEYEYLFGYILYKVGGTVYAFKSDGAPAVVKITQKVRNLSRPIGFIGTGKPTCGTEIAEFDR